MVRFLDLISSRLTWLSVIAVLLVKVIVPFGVGGLANISGTLDGIDIPLVLSRTNQERTSLGLEPLTTDPLLERAARARLDDMEASGYFGHVSPDGRWPWHFIAQTGYSYDVAGENLGRGFYDPGRLVDAWMASTAHRANIVNGTYSDIGMAARRIQVNGRQTLVVVQLFAAPRTTAVVAGVTSPSPAPVAAREEGSFGIAFSGAQAVSSEPQAPSVTEPVRSNAFRNNAVDRAAGAARNGLGVWLLAVASAFLAFAVIERRHRFLMVSAVHVALLMVLTMTPSLAAYSGYIL